MYELLKWVEENNQNLVIKSQYYVLKMINMYI